MSTEFSAYRFIMVKVMLIILNSMYYSRSISVFSIYARKDSIIETHNNDSNNSVSVSTPMMSLFYSSLRYHRDNPHIQTD